MFVVHQLTIFHILMATTVNSLKSGSWTNEVFETSSRQAGEGTYWWMPIVANNSSVHIRHVELACVQRIYLKKKNTCTVTDRSKTRQSLCQLSSPARSFIPHLLLSGSLVSQSPPPASTTYRAVQQPVISSALAHTNKNMLKHHTLRSSGGSYLSPCEGLAGGSPWLSCGVAPARRG